MLRDLPSLGPRISNDDSIFMNGASGLPDQLHEQREDPLDDVFGSAPSSPNLTARDAEASRPGAQHHDLFRLRSTHTTNGYREGIAASKEKYIQEGFDEGYSLGGEIGMKVGYCLGGLEGILVAARKANKEIAERAKTLLETAQEELQLENLFGPEYFSDGVWLYDVPEETTFSEVAARHPVVKKWHDAVMSLASELGLVFKE